MLSSAIVSYVNLIRWVTDNCFDIHLIGSLLNDIIQRNLTRLLRLLQYIRNTHNLALVNVAAIRLYRIEQVICGEAVDVVRVESE